MEPSDDAVIRVLAFTLHEAAKQNHLVTGPTLQLTRFHTLSPPRIPILKYLQMIREKSQCDRSCFVVAMILLDRLVRNNSSLQITPNTVHKLSLCALLTAAKFNTDCHHSNSLWAEIGGVRQEDLNVLELEFLFGLQFSLLIKEEEYEKYSEDLKLKAQLPPFAHPDF